MSELLTSLIVEVATSNVGEVQKSIKKTENHIKSLEKREKELNETIKQGGADAEKATKQHEKLVRVLEKKKAKLAKLNSTWEANFVRLKQNIAPLAKLVGSFTALGVAIAKTAQFAHDAMEVADAAKEAGMSVEEFQAKDGNKYQLFSKEDVEHAKEYEMTMRDIRMGIAVITGNLSSMLLPIITNVAKVVKSITDFFAEHYPAVRMGIVAIGAALAIAFGVQVFKNIGNITQAIKGIGLALKGLIAANPWLFIIGTIITGIILLLDDLYAWFTGGESALAGFWEKIFGPVEEAKVKLANFIETIKNLPKAIMDFITGIIGKIKGFWDGLPEPVKKILSGTWKATPIGAAVTIGQTISQKVNGSHADGLDYVPFDGYIAELHKGERVQTAAEADDWRSGLIAAKRAINFTSQFPLNSIPQGSISNAYSNSNSNRTIQIGDITIQTQATSAQGIADDLASAIKRAVISLDDGMLA